MTYNPYTQKIIIKNPKELLKSADLMVKNGKISGFRPLDQKIYQRSEANAKGLEIIAPGFINLHAHLAYTDIKLKSQNLFPWLGALMEKFDGGNNNCKDFDIYQSSLNGAKEAISFGTTFLVDNSSNLEASIEAFKISHLRGLIGLEIFGADPDEAKAIFNKQMSEMQLIIEKYLGRRKSFSDFESAAGEGPGTTVLGGVHARNEQITETFSHNLGFCIPPHAVYDVSHQLWKLIIDWSSKHELPVLSHIAESKEEENWFKNKNANEAKDFWRSIGTLETKEKNWQASESSIKYFCELILDKINNPQNQSQSKTGFHKGSKIILAHGVHADENDLKLLKEKNISLVSCPRSNEFLNNGLPKIDLWEKLQIQYGIGTDSKASNYDLDLRKEVNRLGDVFNLSAKRKFELLTTAPAKILGLENQIGRLDEGKSADYTVSEILPERQSQIDFDNLNDEKIFELLFDTEITKVKEVFIAGEKVF